MVNRNCFLLAGVLLFTIGCGSKSKLDETDINVGDSGQPVTGIDGGVGGMTTTGLAGRSVIGQGGSTAGNGASDDKAGHSTNAGTSRANAGTGGETSSDSAANGGTGTKAKPTDGHKGKQETAGKDGKQEIAGKGGKNKGGKQEAGGGT
jgi:hypothetical protein